jgi:scyllo-inositol 2-dehydrogenase (NADP+)
VLLLVSPRPLPALTDALLLAMAPPLRTAIAGLGRIGYSFHLQHCVIDPRFEVVAVVDKEHLRCAEAALEFPDVATFSTWDELLASPQTFDSLDVVVIATPTQLHRQMACDAMARGCDVIVEKPLAPSVAEVDAIAEAAQRHGRQCFVFQPHRWSAESRGAKAIIDSGLLGPLYCIRRTYHTYRRYVRLTGWLYVSATHCSLTTAGGAAAPLSGATTGRRSLPMTAGC